MSKRDYVEIANDYARGVVRRKIPACLYVRQAAQRHLDGVKQQRTKAHPYVLDAIAAERVCRFVELCPHVKDEWARKRETIRLEPWQAFILVNVFGWKRKRDGLRRYRRVYIEVPRKNGKSSFTAAVALYMFAADGEHGSEVYSGATSEKQAWEVFSPARLMAKNTPAMLAAYGVLVGAKNLSIMSTASKFEPIIGKPGDGASPSFSVTDEYHEHVTSEQYDTMVTGMGSRSQPIAWVITTAGSNTAGPCYALREQAVGMLAGDDWPDLFGIIYTLDAADAWDAPASLRKANPNYGISIHEDFLLTQQRNALNDPRLQSVFKTKHLNVWVTAAAPYFNLDAWNRLADPSLRIEDFRYAPCFIGLDLAQKVDLCSKVLLFPREVAGVVHYYVFGSHYAPDAKIHAPENRHYEAWATEGHLRVTPGDRTDYDYIESDIVGDAGRHGLVQVGSDPYNAPQLLTHLQQALGPQRVLEIPQTVAHLSDPMKELQALIVSGRIHHTGDPVLAWAIGNVTAQEDRNQNVFPRKEFRDKKIDPAVALIIALGLAVRQPKQDDTPWFVGTVPFGD